METNVDKSEVDRLTMLEGKVDNILKSLDKLLQKEEEEDEDEGLSEVPKKKDKEKEASPKAEPKPGEGEIKLPKASAGETDEKATPTKDEVKVTEKSIKEMIKSGIEDESKTRGITKSASSRPMAQDPSDVLKETKQVENDIGMDVLKKARLGASPGEINQMIKKAAAVEADKRRQKFKDIMAED